MSLDTSRPEETPKSEQSVTEDAPYQFDTSAQIQECREYALSGLIPDPDLTVSEWADKYRILSQVSSGEPGQWNTDRTPYLREIMDELSPSSATEMVVFMKGAQVGGTEAGNNWIGSIVHVTPGPALVVQPTSGLGKRWSKQRLAPLIEHTPELRERVKEARERDSGNTIESKEFPGGIIVVTGANSAVGLRSMPVRFLFEDEVDGYPSDIDGEGDPLDLAEQRTATFANRKIFRCSTPTVKGASKIETSYEQSDQRKYFVPCPFCDHFQVLVWQQVKWPEGKPRDAKYECENCSGLIENHQKTEMLSRGEWIATAQGDGKTAGFHLSALYSPVGWLSWGDLALQYVKAGKDPVKLKVFTNTKLGLTFEDVGETRIDEHGLYARREEYGPTLPEQVCLLTAGVDVQDDRLELEVTGWGVGEESWSILHKRFYGDPSQRAVWNEVDGYLKRRYAHTFPGLSLGIAATCVDTGGHHTQRAYEFCRARLSRKVWAIRGMAGKRPVWPRIASHKNKGNVPLFLIGVDTAKEAVVSRLKLTAPGAGYCHFPLRDEDGERGLEYFEQLSAETVTVREVKGREKREWVKKAGRRNEALDLRVYSYAALISILSTGARLVDLAAAVEAKRPKEEQPVTTREAVIVAQQAAKPVVRRPVRFRMG